MELLKTTFDEKVIFKVVCTIASLNAAEAKQK